MLKLFDFKCETCGNVSEELVKDSDKTGTCPKCGGHTNRIISPVMSKLDGTDPGFPGEYMKWERKRNGHIRGG